MAHQMIKIIVQIGRKRKQGGHVAVLTAWHNDEEIKSLQLRNGAVSATQ